MCGLVNSGLPLALLLLEWADEQHPFSPLL